MKVSSFQVVVFWGDIIFISPHRLIPHGDHINKITGYTYVVSSIGIKQIDRRINNLYGETIYIGLWGWIAYIYPIILSFCTMSMMNVLNPTIWLLFWNNLIYVIIKGKWENFERGNTDPMPTNGTKKLPTQNTMVMIHL